MLPFSNCSKDIIKNVRQGFLRPMWKPFDLIQRGPKLHHHDDAIVDWY